MATDRTAEVPFLAGAGMFCSHRAQDGLRDPLACLFSVEVCRGFIPDPSAMKTT